MSRAVHSIKLLAAALASLALTSCGGDGPTAPSAKSIAPNSSTTLSGTPGAAVSALPSVIVKDDAGAGVGGVTVTFAIVAGGGTLTGGTATTGANGIATVGSWTLGPEAGVNTMTATVAGLSPVTFNATSVVHASALSVTAGSTTARSGIALATQPVIQLKNATGGSLAQAGVVVTAALTSGGGTLGGTTTATTDAAGAAAFTNLSISGPVGPHGLSFSASGTTAVATLDVDLTAGVASTIAINDGDGQSAAQGTKVATSPSVIVQDADGNPVSAIAVTFAVQSGGGSITGGTQTTNASGIARVGSWTLGSTKGANVLTASSTGLTGSPVSFTATAIAPPSKLVVGTAPSTSAVNRAAFAVQPVIQLQDANGNVVPTAGVVVSAAITAGGGTLGGTTTATTAATGAATFTDLSIAGLAGTRTITFTSTGLTSTTATVTTTAGPAANVALNAGNGQSATGGTAVAVPPSVLVTDADGNPVSGTVVTFAIASGGGSLTGGTATSNASGIASVGSWTLGSTPGTNTMTATADGLAGSPLTFTATGVKSGALLIYGGITERVKLLDPAAVFSPTITVSSSGLALPANSATYTSRATSVATVNADGTVTAVANGQAWIVASYQTELDSIFVLVTKSAAGPVLRADVVNYAVTSGSVLTVDFTLDPKATVVGSAVVTIGYEIQNGMFSNPSATVPTQTIQPVLSSVGSGVYRSSVANASGITSPVIMGEVKLTAGSAGLAGWLTFTVVGIVGTDGADLSTVTTTTRYPIIIR